MSPPGRYSLAGRVLRGLLAGRGAALAGLDPQGREDLKVVHETRRLTALLMQDVPALNLMAWARAARRLGGAMAEAGVFTGGTARLICEAKRHAPLHLFDVFEGLQHGTAETLTDSERAVSEHFGTVHGTLGDVQRLLAPYDAVEFHPGWFPGSAAGLGEMSFCFVHLDLDLAQGTRDAIEFFYPRLLPGGVIVGDDYHLPAVRDCFESYFAGRADAVTALPWGQVVVVKAER